MSASSPSPNSPPQSTIPSSTPPPTPPSQPNANPPDSSNSTSDSPPPLSPPIAPLPPPPPPTPVQSPPPLASPPPATPPPLSLPLPVSPPPQTSVSPPPSDPPSASPPPPASAQPPENPPPPPAASPPRNSPPQPASPTRSPPPPTPPDSDPPVSPPPPPEDSPPPPPPRRSPPPSPPPPVSNPTPPPENSPPDPSPPLPPQPAIHLSPPPPPPSSSRVPISPSGNDTSGDPAPNAPRSAESNGNAGIGTGGVAAIAAVAGILLLSLLGLVFWCVRKRRRKVSGLSGYVMPSPSASSKLDSAFLKAHSTAPIIGSGSGSDFVDSSRDPGGPGNSRPFFAFEELVQATSGFSAQNLLGEGGFGSVYKGYLPDGTEIAVKQLKIGGGQGEREFKAEVETISRVHHRHLVSLVGYCISDTRRLLVYNYVPNNNLYYHLHGEGRPVLEWAIRVKVAAGAARGIAYLHEDCHPRIIHRDIKSSNILLDSNFEARVSDFGLAKLALDADTHITTRVMGTFGYVAPEYASSGKLTDKSDVYSYGVVLLELITGRKPVDASQPLGDESLVEWARPLLSNAIESGEYGSLVDPKLESNYVETEMFRMIEIAAACVRHSSAKRPRMGQVVRAFDSLGVSDITNGMKVGESEVFNSAQQSEEIRWFRRMAFGSQDYSTDFFSQDSLNTRERPEKTMNESGL